MRVLNKIRYAVKANHFKGYAIHSPYIFGVVSNLIYCKYPFYCFGKLSQTYGQLPKVEKKAALSLKDGFRLFRLLNTLKPSTLKTYSPDKFDTAILSSFKTSALKATKKPHTSINAVLFISSIHANEWKGVQKQYGNDTNVVFVVKQPNTFQKNIWVELLKMKNITSVITFYGMGIAFTHTHLPTKNFKIVK